jgi:serine/threonine-protein kinase RsbW
MKNLNCSFELGRDLTELDTLFKILENYGQSLGLSKKCMFEINLCAEELFTNIISYGFKDNLEHLVKVNLECKNDELVLCIEDEGIPFNPVEKESPELPCDIECRKIGGLGIHLIKNLMDDICYERCEGGNKLTLKKCIAPA